MNNLQRISVELQELSNEVCLVKLLFLDLDLLYLFAQEAGLNIDVLIVVLHAAGDVLLDQVILAALVFDLLNDLIVNSLVAFQ